jgi:hypothetical protein
MWTGNGRSRLLRDVGTNLPTNYPLHIPGDRHLQFPYILWQVDPLLGNDSEISSYITAVAKI